ncbi:uncharacterized protein LOC144360063, partial [Saccoglossus kowalevskii]
MNRFPNDLPPSYDELVSQQLNQSYTQKLYPIQLYKAQPNPVPVFQPNVVITPCQTALNEQQSVEAHITRTGVNSSTTKMIKLHIVFGLLICLVAVVILCVFIWVITE